MVIAPELKQMGARDFWTLLGERQVTHINSVPSFIESILDAAPPPEKLSLKRLMLGGEALQGALVARIRRTLPQLEVVNMYGPTETCIDATYHIATAQDEGATVLPIGRPLPNYRVYVLNEWMEPVGIGVSGELYIGGSGLASGYVNAPELTAERFVADPFSSQPGARLYRTGDRARWRSDQRLEFLGRVDQQIKIRGFRVEPAEIEAVLLGHPEISQAVVVPTRGQSLRLAAYFVPRNQASIPQAADLRSFLADRLPDYMVPSAFLAISQIPLTPNGKLDASALPSIDATENEYVSPRTPTEETVASLFAEVLGLERCGATDHFFELGGHSLLATSLVSKLRNAGITVHLRAVFETPTVEALSRRIDNSLPSQVAALPISATPRPADIPLSFAQERIWFVDRLQQDSSYNIPVAFSLRGQIDVDALEKALTRIVARHEALRTRIVLRDGRPVQEVLPPSPIALPRLDLTAVDSDQRDFAIQENLVQLAARRFDLAADAPVEMRLIQLETEHHVFAAVIHHVAFDGWSAGIFFRELTALYSAFVQDRSDQLSLPSLQYADFSIWQRRQDYKDDLDYWLEELRGIPPASELPRSSLLLRDTAYVGSVGLKVDSSLYADLSRLALLQGASLFMVLHAAFAHLLARWNGQQDVVIGTVVANRNRSELESVIGCFVNTIPLRTTFEGLESFEQLLSRVRDKDLAAFAHQDVPLEQLVQALHPERSVDRTPIFQVLLVLENTPPVAGELPGLEIGALSIPVQAPQFDLTLSLSERDSTLSGGFEFAAQRFSPEDIGRFARQFERLLRSITNDPSQHLSQISVLDPAERSLLIGQWSGIEADFPGGTLDGLFAEQVRQSPDAVAVVGVDGTELSYRDLDERASRFAKQLMHRGAKAGSVVGVRLPRSTESIICLLAILKAGGIYLPLDPAYPAERLDYMAADAGALLVLDAAVLQAWNADNTEQEVPLPPLDDAHRVAYIIYTSGTTGKPKGVAVPHSAAVNLAYGRRACHDPLGSGDRVLAAISVGFDVSIGQLLLPLLSGATVVIAPELKQMGARDFWTLLGERQVTHINSVPSFIESILDAAPPPEKLSLKRLMLGGEALQGALVARIRRTLPQLEVVNMYGPTETCIDATYHIATAQDEGATVLPIGRPLPNYRVYVLNEWMEPVGIGVSGELYIGGSGLASGYVNAPELTAERFVADPFSSQPGARLYRTGDRARWRSDQRLEFLGRADRQIKIRGFRVEPAEIEAQLRLQPGVREAAVVAQSGGGDARLIAYYTANDGLEADQLRGALGAVLPDYMVPVAFLHLDRLPLTPNGKLDRNALPAPDPSAFPARAYEAPVGEVECKMAALWGALLQREQIGRHDNFFELGGHSLLAVTLIERMQQQGLPGNVRDLFITPTIAGLAGAAPLATAPLSPPANSIPAGCEAITPEMLPLLTLTQSQIDRIVAGIPGGAANVQDIYPLSPLQEGILFQYLMTTEEDAYLTPFVLRFDARERLDRFVSAMGQVVARHDVLRTSMVWKDVDEPLQVVARKANLPVEEVDLDRSSSMSGVEQLLAHFKPRTYRMDVSRAPLLRAALAHDVAEQRWLLLLLTHHLILDHTSMEIVVGELSALMENPHATLPPPLPYRNFIAESRRSGTRAEHGEFFSKLLGDVDEPTAPFGLLDIQDHTHGEQDGIEEGHLRLEENLSRRVREQARALGVTPASVFHLAWAIVLGYAAGKRDVVFGTVLFGRMRSGAGADRVVGMFINTLPFRLKLDSTGVVASLLRTHQLLAELLVHEHAPLALAQRCSGVAAPAPLFTSLFNYRYSPEATPNPQGSPVEVVYASERTNYPLAMAVDDSGATFVLNALAHPVAGGKRVCEYLRNAVSELLDCLEFAPQTPVASVSVLSREERSQLVTEWSGREEEYAQGRLEVLFARQAQSQPNALAVVGVDRQTLSYAELHVRSSALARRLLRRGVQSGSVVGVRLPRSS